MNRDNRVHQEGQPWLRRLVLRLALGCLLVGVLVLAAGSLIAPHLLRRAQDGFARAASEPSEAWLARHPGRAEDDVARRLTALAAALDEPRPGDPSLAVKGPGSTARFQQSIHLSSAMRQMDTMPLPASAAHHAWMEARVGEFDEIVALLANGAVVEMSWSPDELSRVGARPAEESRLLNLRGKLLSRALDDAARDNPERAERDLRAAWALDEAQRASPDRAWASLFALEETLAVLRVVRPAAAEAWIARLDAVAPRALMHDGIMWSVVSVPAAEAALEEPLLPDFTPQRTMGLKRSPARLVRAWLVSQLVSSLGELDATLARASPCADTMAADSILAPAWIVREVSGDLCLGIDDALVVSLRAREIDLALTRRVLEVSADLPNGTECASEWLTETRVADGRVTVAWNGMLPSGRDAWRAWFPLPFTVQRSSSALK